MVTPSSVLTSAPAASEPLQASHSTAPASNSTPNSPGKVMTLADVTNYAFELRRGTPQYVPMAARLQAAERLREALCSVPFYAKRAERARQAGDEMAYWLGLQASEATLRRPPAASSTSAEPGAA